MAKSRSISRWTDPADSFKSDFWSINRTAFFGDEEPVSGMKGQFEGYLDNDTALHGYQHTVAFSNHEYLI